VAGLSFSDHNTYEKMSIEMPVLKELEQADSILTHRLCSLVTEA